MLVEPVNKEEMKKKNYKDLILHVIFWIFRDERKKKLE